MHMASIACCHRAKPTCQSRCEAASSTDKSQDSISAKTKSHQSRIVFSTLGKTTRDYANTQKTKRSEISKTAMKTRNVKYYKKI